MGIIWTYILYDWPIYVIGVTNSNSHGKFYVQYQGFPPCAGVELAALCHPWLRKIQKVAAAAEAVYLREAGTEKASLFGILVWGSISGTTGAPTIQKW